MNNDPTLPMSPEGTSPDPRAAANSSRDRLAETVYAGDGTPIEPQDNAFDELLHDRVFGQYIIQDLRGKGGMGRVYKAWHTALHRFCALKVLTAEHVRNNAERLRMFHNEARAAAGLSHPNVVSVHSLGSERGFHYIEMEYVEGPSLGEELSHREGPFEPLDATEMIWQLCQGLGAAHRRKVTHGDIKPDNAMLAPDGRVKLTDFGLSRIQADSNPSNRKTGGTPAYMAPELFHGYPICAATDVYALGISWFQLLTGEVPFRSRSLNEMQMYHTTGPTPDPREFRPAVPDDVAQMLAMMLVKDPSRRLCDIDAWNLELHKLVLTLTDLSVLVRRAMEPTSIQWSGDGRNYEFIVGLSDGRSQTVFGELRDDFPQASTAGPLISFWTPCAPASNGNYEYVLKMNSRVPYGGLGVHEYKGQPYFVMSQNHPRRTLDPEEIRVAVEQLAHWGDLVENELTGGKDTH